MKNTIIELYTKGSCVGYQENNNIGKSGLVIVRNGIIYDKIVKTYKDTTNNKMEMLSVVEGLAYCLFMNWKEKKIIVFNDTDYIIKGIKEYLKFWRDNGFSKKPILLNAEIWATINILASNFGNLSFEYTKNSKNIEYSEQVKNLISFDKYNFKK